MNTRIF